MDALSGMTRQAAGWVAWAVWFLVAAVCAMLLAAGVAVVVRERRRTGMLRATGPEVASIAVALAAFAVQLGSVAWLGARLVHAGDREQARGALSPWARVFFGAFAVMALASIP